MTLNLEEVLQAAQQLPLEDQRLLSELIETPKSLEELAAAQGVKPFDFAEARQAATFWPPDENLEDFLTTLRAWRQETGTRELE